MRFILTDFKRALTERTFFAALGMGMLCLFGALLFCLTQEIATDATGLFLESQSLLLPFIAPLLATLPYSNMSMLEKDSGYWRLLYSKNNRRTYFLARWLVVGIVGGLALTLPLVCLALTCSFLAPMTSTSATLMGQVVLLDFLFGFSYATIGYGLTFVNTKRYLPVIIPQVLYLLFIYAFPYLGLETFYPPLGFAPSLLPQYANLSNILFTFAALTGISLLLVGCHTGYEWVKNSYIRWSTKRKEAY